MVDEPKPMNRAELDQKIVALAWKDEAFRKAFLADPKGEAERRLGTKLPAGLKIAAYAEDANHLHFVIPRKPEGLAELSDGDLEKVAGGIDAVVATIIASAVTALIGTGASLINKENADRGRESW